MLADKLSQKDLPDDKLENDSTPENSINIFLLLVGIIIMLIGSTFPVVFTNATGKADHGIAMALFWSMSAGIVRGVGFVPQNKLFKLIFSGWACMAGLVLAASIRFL